MPFSSSHVHFRPDVRLSASGRVPIHVTLLPACCCPSVWTYVYLRPPLRPPCHLPSSAYTSVSVWTCVCLRRRLSACICLLTSGRTPISVRTCVVHARPRPYLRLSWRPPASALTPTCVRTYAYLRPDVRLSASACTFIYVWTCLRPRRDVRLPAFAHTPFFIRTNVHLRPDDARFVRTCACLCARPCARFRPDVVRPRPDEYPPTSACAYLYVRLYVLARSSASGRVHITCLHL